MNEVRSSAPTPAEEPALDPEMRDVVNKFEQAFAELAPDLEEPSPKPKPKPADDPFANLFADFPQELDNGKRAAEAAPTRYAPQRESVAAPGQTSPVVQKDKELDIEEAFSILRAAEEQGKAAAELTKRESTRTAEDTEPPLAEAGAPPLSFERPVTPRVESKAESVLSRSNSQSELMQDTVSWSTKARNAWSGALVAVAIALAVGTGVGYMMGHSKDFTSGRAAIQTTDQGGAKLRPEYDLRKR